VKVAGSGSEWPGDVRFDPFATNLFALQRTPLRAKTGLMQHSRGRAWLQCGVRSAASARAYHIGEKLKAASRDKGINLASRPAPAARLSMMGL
jgi:hypothetical protein